MNENNYFYECSRFRCLANEQKLTDDLFLTMCGEERCIPNYEFHTQGRPGYHFHVILSGKGVLSVNGEVHNLHFGQMFITKPNEDTWYRANGEDPWVYCWMTFDGNKAAQLVELAGFPDGKNHLECRMDHEVFYSIVKKLLDLPELSMANDLIHMGLLLEFLGMAIKNNYMLDNKAKRVTAYSTETYVQYAANYIQANFNNAKIADVARNVGLHRSYLTSIFKQKMGVSPQEYLMQCKMKRASAYLLETDLPVQEISRTVGYDNPLTFSKVFRSFFGLSPRNYRENMRGMAGDRPEKEEGPSENGNHL